MFMAAMDFNLPRIRHDEKKSLSITENSDEFKSCTISNSGFPQISSICSGF